MATKEKQWMLYSSVLGAFQRWIGYTVTVLYLVLKGLDMFMFHPNQRRITIKNTSPTFSAIHRRHFEESGYVIIRMSAWMLTMRNRAHNYDALPRQLKCFDYAEWILQNYNSNSAVLSSSGENISRCEFGNCKPRLSDNIQRNDAS